MNSVSLKRKIKLNLNDLSNHLLLTSGPQIKFLTVSETVVSLWLQSSKEIVNIEESTTSSLRK